MLLLEASCLLRFLVLSFLLALVLLEKPEGSEGWDGCAAVAVAGAAVPGAEAAKPGPQGDGVTLR